MGSVKGRFGCGSIRIGIDIWKCDPEKLTKPEIWEGELRKLVSERGLGARRAFVDPYDGGMFSGFELFLTLDDSFIAVETWPAGLPAVCPHPYVKVVLDFCHHSGDHAEDAEWVARKIEDFVRIPGTVTSYERTYHGP